MDRNIANGLDVVRGLAVALLAEGVDRNFERFQKRLPLDTSPSSRRAWIEISKVKYNIIFTTVALLAEGVDRN